MNILLRKLWILSSLMLAANAEIVFNLDDQEFQNASGKDANGQTTEVKEITSRYNLPKTYVSTGLVYTGGDTGKGYTLKGNRVQDQFRVELKSPISTWNVNFSVSWYFDECTHTIKFTSDTGKTIIMGMTDGKIYFNSKEKYVTFYFPYLYYITTEATVSMDGSNVTFNVPGMGIKTITIPNFSKLKYVSITILNDDKDLNFNYFSKLKSLTIGSAD